MPTGLVLGSDYMVRSVLTQVFSRVKVTNLGPKASPGMADVTPREELGSAVTPREEHSVDCPLG